jgi:DnaK suppressor protein
LTAAVPPPEAKETVGKTPRPSKTAKKPAAKAKTPATKPTKAPAKSAPEKKPAGKDAKVTKSKAASPAPAAPPRKPAAAPPTKGAAPTTGKKPAAETAPPVKPAKAPEPAPAPAPPAAAAAAANDPRKPGPKGITIVTPKPSKPSKPKPKFQMPVNEPLLRPGSKWKPLIPSGPSAPPRTDFGHSPIDGSIKTKFTKKELERYRAVLLQKRAELVGDVRNMEDEALRQSSGSLSHTPQHMAEQGTDVFDQSLNLDLAQVDRNLIREIDAALERIENGTYGVCELTGKMITAERLEELPWARYSIEAARERERRSFQP